MKVPTFLLSRSNGRSGKLLRRQSKTTPIQPKFSLEQLEPRLLLSATTGAEDELSSLISSNSYQDELYNPLAIVVETSESQADGTDNEQFVQPIETELCNDLNLLPEPIIQIDLDPGDSESNPVESLNNDFMPGVDLQGDNAESTAINLSKGVGDLGTDWDLLIPETNVFPSNSTSDFEDLSSDKADSDNDNSSTEQLIETLLAANPPPALTVSDFSETTAEPLSFNILSGLNDITLRLTDIDGIEILQLIDNEGAVQTEQALANTSKVVITGLAGEDDTLTIDFSGGTIPVPISFHGGDGGFDSLVIVGGSFSEASYSASGPDAGIIVLGETTITYTGLEPITDDNIVDDRVFTITTTGVDQQVRIGDDSDPNNGYSTIDSNGTGGFESITFLNPANSLTVYSGDGNDTIILDTPDNGFIAPVIINSEAGVDTLDLANVASNLTITFRADGSVSVIDGVNSVNNITNVENIVGGSGSNIYVFEDGASLVGTIGGSGTATLDYSAYTTIVTVDLAAGTATGTAGVSNMQNVIGGAGSDTLIGDGASNTLIGNAGDDTLSGGLGADTLDGGAGTDRLVEQRDADFTLTDTVLTIGLEGTDSLVGVEVAELDGGISANILDASAFTGLATLAGKEGDDILIGGSGSDSFDGGAGTDTLVADGTANTWSIIGANAGTLNGQAFINIENLTGSTGTDTIVADDTANTWNITGINAGSLNSQTFTGIENLVGGSGADTFVFSDGAAVTGIIDGSGGFNTLDYSAYTTDVTVDLEAGAATGASGVSNIQNVTGGVGNDALIGDGVANNLVGGPGNDLLTGGLGNDTLDGGAGADTLAETRDADFTLTDIALTIGLEGTDILVGIEKVIITGGASRNTLDASEFSGLLTFAGGEEDDTFITGLGTNNFAGGPGDDTLTGGDWANLWGITGQDAGRLNGDVFTEVEYLLGGAVADTFIILAAAAVISKLINGRSGDDELKGNNGVNIWTITSENAGMLNSQAFVNIENLNGSSVEDDFIFSDGAAVTGTIDGSGGINTLDYPAYTTGVVVDLGASTATGTAGVSNIQNVTGGAGSDILTGDSAANTLIGNAGDDTLTGGLGADTLDGGAGTDRLVEQRDADFTLTDTILTIGLEGTDSLVGIEVAELAGGISANILDASAFTGLVALAGKEGDDILIGGSGSDSFDGGTGSDTLVADNTINTWNITGANAGTLNSQAFINIENLTGSTGTDTIVADDTANTWNITGINAGKLNSQTFINIENLTGGTDTDDFVFAEGGSISGVVDGGNGYDTLDYSTYISDVVVNLGAGVSTSVGGVNNIENLISGGGNDTLVGPNTASVWNITGTDSGDVEGFKFTGIENLTGALDNEDTFVFADGGTINHIAGGSGGYDTVEVQGGIYSVVTLNYTGSDSGSIELDGAIISSYSKMEAVLVTSSGRGPPTTVTINALTVASNEFTLRDEGTADNGIITIYNTNGTFAETTFEPPTGSLIINSGPGSDTITVELLEPDFDLLINGEAGNDTLIGPAVDTTWYVTGPGIGSVGGVNFTGIENLTGAADNEDTFVFYENGSLSGVVYGGAEGFDRLVLLGSFDTVIYTPAGPDSGTVSRDGDVITYAGLEPITGGDANTTIFNGTGGVDEWVVENHLTMGRIQIRSLTAAIETTDFNNPNIELQINLGADADSLTIEALDSAFNADLTVDAGIGDDEITINAVTGGGTYTIDGGDVIINNPLILYDDTILRSIGGNITINGSVDSEPVNNYSLTLESAGTVTIGGAIGAVDALTDLNVNVEAGTDVIFQSTVDLGGSFTITASGSVDFNGAVTLGDRLVINAGASFDNTGAPISTMGEVYIEHTGAVTLGASLTAPGANVTIIAGTTLTCTADASIDTAEGPGNPGGSGGEIVLRSTGPGAITVDGAISASGAPGVTAGTNGGNAGIISIVNKNGAITVANIESKGGNPGAGATPGADGMIQLKATGAISQSVGTTIKTGKLKIIAGGDVILDKPGNNVEVIAAEVSNGANITYVDADHLIIGTISESGIANLPEKAGIIASGGDDGDITVETRDGSMLVSSNIVTAGHGDIFLETKGAAKDLIISATVKSGDGLITLTATGFVAYSALGNVVTNLPSPSFLLTRTRFP